LLFWREGSGARLGHPTRSARSRPRSCAAIYSTNFGEASSHLDDARGLLGRANDRLKSLGRNDEVTQVQMA
jgi:hypothetical protein